MLENTTQIYLDVSKMVCVAFLWPVLKNKFHCWIHPRCMPFFFSNTSRGVWLIFFWNVLGKWLVKMLGISALSSILFVAPSCLRLSHVDPELNSENYRFLLRIDSYCWWKKSCTTCDVENLINVGAGFLPSTVWNQNAKSKEPFFKNPIPLSSFDVKIISWMEIHTIKCIP